MKRTHEDESIHPSFRIQAKHVFITYPQFDCDKMELLQHLQSLYAIEKAIIARELHADGEPHIHAYISWKKKIDCRDERKFDYKGKHPNIQKCKNIQATIQYCQKDDMEPLKFGFDDRDEITDLYQFARETPEEEFFEECRKQKGIHPSLI